MYTLENNELQIEVNPQGAELSRLYSKRTGLEYLWNGEEKIWNRRSPVLFPVVGRLKNDTYYFSGKPYHLIRHGFARDSGFELEGYTNDSVTYVLSDSDQSRKSYPFPFRLHITHRISGNTVTAEYNVENPGESNMYFSLGGHPAFRLPLEPHLLYNDYYFEFSHVENAHRWLISSEGLVEPVTAVTIDNTNVLPITKELFHQDALVFKFLNSSVVKLKTDRSEHGVEFSFPRFPYLGLWAAKNANFVCIEPWCGIADSTTSDQQFITKEGINLLAPGQAFRRSWSATVY